MFELLKKKKVLIGYGYYVGTILLRFADRTRLLGNGFDIGTVPVVPVVGKFSGVLLYLGILRCNLF